METSDKSLLKVLASKGAGTVAIFDKGDFYTCYGEDAKLLATEVFKSEFCLRTISLTDDTPLAYTDLNTARYQRVVKELLLFLRHRVELYELDEAGKWSLKAKGTVGNMADFEDILGDISNNGNTIMAAHIKDNTVSLCFVDTMDFRITTAEFTDSSTFGQTEQTIVAMNPRECFLCCHTDDKTKRKFITLLKKMHVMETAGKLNSQACFDTVCQLFKKDSEDHAKSLSETLKRLLSSVCDYLKLAEQTGFSAKFTLSDFRTSGFMHIDAAAVKALELFSLSYLEDSGVNGTLFSVLNKCKTITGQRLLRDWIARPLCDAQLIGERLDAVDALVQSADERRTLYSALLSRVPDLSHITRKLLQGKAKLQDCYRIYQLINTLGLFETELRNIYNEHEKFASSVKELLLEPICFAIAQLDRFSQLITSSVDVEYFERNGSFRIRPDIDPQLLELAQQMEIIEENCEKARKKVSSKLELDSVKLDTNAQYGYFYRVTLKDEKAIRKNNWITVLDTNKGSGIRFRDEALEDLNSNYREVHNIYLTAQCDLENKVIETCAGYCDVLNQLSSALAQIDVLVSLATVSNESANVYTRPVLEPMGSGIFELEEVRHPVLEAVLDTPFFANDVKLGANRLIVLTGANMGGKSTYLRSAALCVLMAQIGSFVPASLARFSLVDGIFTRVGASDQQTRGISTFMAEMVDSASILEMATSNSLVIVDELGRGTSTFDGFGLAWAIASDILKRIKCFCLFATHFHEMADLSSESGCISMQMNVIVDNGRICMTYRVEPGVAQSSFGMHVARSVGFPSSVVQEAEKTLTLLEEEDLISRLKSKKGEELRQALLSL